MLCGIVMQHCSNVLIECTNLMATVAMGRCTYVTCVLHKMRTRRCFFFVHISLFFWITEEWSILFYGVQWLEKIQCEKASLMEQSETGTLHSSFISTSCLERYSPTSRSGSHHRDWNSLLATKHFSLQYTSLKLYTFASALTDLCKLVPKSCSLFASWCFRINSISDTTEKTNFNHVSVRSSADALNWGHKTSCFQMTVESKHTIALVLLWFWFSTVIRKRLILICCHLLNSGWVLLEGL